MAAKDRRFSLPSLFGIIALFAVSLGLIRLGLQVSQRFLFVVGATWLIAGVGAVIGFLVSGQRGVVAGAAFTVLAVLLLACAVVLCAVTH